MPNLPSTRILIPHVRPNTMKATMNARIEGLAFSAFPSARARPWRRCSPTGETRTGSNLSRLKWHHRGSWFPLRLQPRCELRSAEYSVRQSLPFWRHFPFAFHLAFYGGYGGLDSFRGCVSRQMTLSRRGVVFMKRKADKSEHHQDGSSYHQPMRILHRGASLVVPHFFTLSSEFHRNPIAIPGSAITAKHSVSLAAM